MDRHSISNQMFTARGEGKMEGLAEGIEKGRAEGRAEIQHEMVLKMAHNGLTPQQIAQFTDIPLDEVNQIIEANQQPPAAH